MRIVHTILSSKAQQVQPQTSAISECSDFSDIVEEDIPAPPSPETGLESVNGVQPELQRTEKESEIRSMASLSSYPKWTVTLLFSQILQKCIS